MPTLAIDEVQARLSEVIDGLSPGHEVVITQDDRPIARLTTEPPVGLPISGRCKGMLTVVADDDEHLEDFTESCRQDVRRYT